MFQARARRHGALLAAVVLLGACSAAVSPGPIASAAPVGLPPCASPPAAVAHEPVEGLTLPDSAVVSDVEAAGPITQARGYLPLTPVEVRQYYAGAGLTILLIEDEVYEAEILLADGPNRLFVKAQAVCDRGSQFVAVVGPQDAADAIPVPSGPPN